MLNLSLYNSLLISINKKPAVITLYEKCIGVSVFYSNLFFKQPIISPEVLLLFVHNLNRSRQPVLRHA